MSALKVLCFSISVDGYGAGPDLSKEHPMGVGGMALHEWVFPTRSFQNMHGDAKAGGTTGIDNSFAEKGFENIGAWILGRGMFTAETGPWLDADWKGWWGEEPPYHVPVFVLTHHPRPSLEMKGGTVFHFVTEGIDKAWSLAKSAANGKDVRLGGGAATVRQYLQAGLVDEMHLAVAPVLLGNGKNLLKDLSLSQLGYVCTEVVPSDAAMHLVFKKRNT